MFIVFIHIMERPVSNIFSACVFNNIMEVTFIFPPPAFFPAPFPVSQITYLISIGYIFAAFTFTSANRFCFLIHNGEP